MTDATEKPKAKVFGKYSPEDDAAFDAAAAKIITDGPKAEPEVFEPEVEVEEAGEAPQVSEEGESEVDADALEEAYEAYRRDSLSDEEIDARLKREGHKRFVSRGLKRQKKHHADDEAHSVLRRLRQEQDTKGNAQPEKTGDRSQAGTPTLNLQESAAPLADRLGLDEEGKKTLVASLKAVEDAHKGELLSQREQLNLVANVLHDMTLEGVRTSTGLDKLEDEDWFRVQSHYDELKRTNLHGELSGKPRMSALLKSAAKLAGVTAADPAEIQRKASIASAKRNGAPVVRTTTRMPEKKMTRDEIFDHVGKLVTSGHFRGKPPSEVREYADKLRAHNGMK